MTVIGFYISSDSGLLTQDVVGKIDQLRDYLSALHEVYEWRIKDAKLPGSHNKAAEQSTGWITDLSGFAQAFKDFSEYVRRNGSDHEGICTVSDPSQRYKPTQGLDIEEGRFDFDRSFEIDEFQFRIFINTEIFYASEIEQLPSAGLDIFCEMNDIDGDYV